MGNPGAQLLFGKNYSGGLGGALGISPDFSGGRVSNGWTAPASTPSPISAGSSGSGGKQGLLPTIGGPGGSSGGSSKFNGNTPSFGGGPSPGYDEDGQRSWDAGAEGYTPIQGMPTTVDNRMARDFLLDK